MWCHPCERLPIIPSMSTTVIGTTIKLGQKKEERNEKKYTQTPTDEDGCLTVITGDGKRHH